MTRQQLITTVAKACIERATVQGWRGEKTKTHNALDFLCGATAALHAIGHQDTDALTMMAFMVSCRGYGEVEHFAKEPVE